MKTRSVAWDRVLPPATLFLLGLVIALPLWGPGLLNTRSGGDSPFLILRTHQLVAALKGGHFPARWMPDAAYGLGFPMFSYYAALPYYLAATLNLLQVDILSAIKLTQTLFAIAAALAAYGWTRRLFDSRAAGWLAGAAYTVAPYHLVNLYVRGDALSEFAAFVFYPLVLWGLDRLLQEPVPRRVLFPALAYAGLILTHNISALTFTPFALLYYGVAVIRRAGDGRIRRTLVGFCAWALGLGLAAWYWLPALAETGSVQLTAQTTGYLFYGNHFRGSDLIQLGPIFDYGAESAGAAFSMGLAQAILAGLGVLLIMVAWARSRRIGWAGATALAGLALSTFMITPASKVVWDMLPLLQLTQFPWRFLSIQALFAALATGSVILSLKHRRWVAATGIAVLLAITAFAGLRPDYLPIAADEITAQQLQMYELFTGNVGSSIRYEYLPAAVIPRPWTGPYVFDAESSVHLYAKDGLVTDSHEIVHEPARREWEVETGPEGATVAVPLYFWPGWRGEVDGEPIQVEPDPDSGVMTLTVPAGRHTVSVRLGRTPLRAVAEAFSLMSIAGVVILVFVGMQGKFWGQLHGTRALAPILLAGLALAILVIVSPRVSPTAEDDLTMDFDQMPLLHHNPNGVSFGAVRLTDYQYSTDHLDAGESLALTLNWEGETEGLSATIQLVSYASHLLDVPGSWAQTQVPLAASTRISLPISHWTSPGPALISIGLYGAEGEIQAISPTDRTLGATFLRPVWIAPSEPVPTDIIATFANGAIKLHAVETCQIDPAHLEVTLGWSSTRSNSANWGLSLRLTDRAGNEWRRLETQPGYGFLPTSLWPQDHLVSDRVTLPLPPGTPPGSAYILNIGLYRVATWEGVGTSAVTVSLPLATIRPDAPIMAQMGGDLALSDLEVPQSVQQGETLRWTAYWLAMEQPQPATAEWRLEGPSVLSTTLPLASGSPPPSWPTGSWIAGRAHLDIPPTAPPGNYTLQLTVRDNNGLPLGTYTHEQPLTIGEQERVWVLPSMQQDVRASFGDMIELAGYDLAQEDDQLQLTLHWRALSVPDRHYTLFVHVADPVTAQPVAQTDTMPRGFTYPTGMWAPEEVISDQVSVSMAGIPPGTYDLVVGWYDPDTWVRLEARDAAGNALPDGRLILPDRVTIP
jgi:hypothetical protein